MFTFTRNPSTKVSVTIEASGLVKADNAVILVGRMAASGSTAIENVPLQIENFGDEVAAQAECDAEFGAGAELTKMVVAAIKANKFSGDQNVVYPPIVVIPQTSVRTSANLAAAFAANIGIPMPFIGQPFAITDATALSALKNHVQAISAADRGDNGQFGSFGVIGSMDNLSNSTTAGESAAYEGIMSPWLRDAGAAQTMAEINAAYAARCASVGQPFLPLNGSKIGGLIAPASKSDWHTSGDAGSISLGLDSGLVPLFIAADGSVMISRSITTYRPISASEATNYYDFQDWKVLYYYRENAYLTSKQPRYAIAKGTDKKLKALLSELIQLALDFQTLEMFQKVEELTPQFSVDRPLDNRFAGEYNIPVNVVPGFMNKGIGVVGTTQFDSFNIA